MSVNGSRSRVQRTAVSPCKMHADLSPYLNPISWCQHGHFLWVEDAGRAGVPTPTEPVQKLVAVSFSAAFGGRPSDASFSVPKPTPHAWLPPGCARMVTSGCLFLSSEEVQCVSSMCPGLGTQLSPQGDIAPWHHCVPGPRGGSMQDLCRCQSWKEAQSKWEQPRPRHMLGARVWGAPRGNLRTWAAHLPHCGAAPSPGSRTQPALLRIFS